MTRRQRLLKIARLVGAIGLTLAATGAPAATLACKDRIGSCSKVCTTGKACVTRAFRPRRHARGQPGVHVMVREDRVSATPLRILALRRKKPNGRCGPVTGGEYGYAVCRCVAVRNGSCAHS